MTDQVRANPAPPRRKSVSVPQMISMVIDSVNVRRARLGNDAPPPAGPLFTFLVGSGFSANAGVPSTRHLVAALDAYQKDPAGTWDSIFDAVRESGGSPGCETTQRYFELMGQVCPLPLARRDFISSATRWAASRQAQVNLESVMLASVLIAGARGIADFDVQRADRHWLARSFARHAFTACFDDLLPTTFHLGNQPVDVIDGASIRYTTAATTCPTVVYLNGRNLHYCPGNCRQSVVGPQESLSGARDSLDQFRDILRTTGLVVIGYSGAEERVVECIRSALGDPDSLPYGLWWSAYRDENDLDPTARELVAQSERSFFLEPGKDAEAVMTSLSREIGIDADLQIAGWSSQTKRIAEAMDKFLERSSYVIRAFLAQARAAGYCYSRDLGTAALSNWAKLRLKVKGLADKRLAADVLNAVGQLEFLYGVSSNAAPTFREALELHRKAGDELGAANDFKGLGDVIFRQGKPDEAEAAYRDAFELHCRVHSDTGAANDLNGIGDVLLLQGKHDDAEMAYRDALDLHRRSGDDLGAANDLRGIGDVLLQRDEPDDAWRAYRDALELHRKAGSDLGAANDLTGIGDALFASGNVSGAEKAYGEALQLHRAVRSELGEANDLNRIAAVWSHDGKNEDAERTYREAFEAHRRAGDDFGAADDLVGLGNILLRAGNAGEAQNAFREAVELHRRAGDELGAANELTGAGDALLGSGRLDEARKAYEEALELHRKVGSSLGAASDLSGLGDALLRAGSVPEAQKAYREALELHRKVEDDLGTANDLRGLGAVLLCAGSVMEAEKSYLEALELHRKAGDELSAANDLRGLADVLLHSGNASEAEKTYREALEIHRRIGDDLGAANDLTGLADAFLRCGNSSEAAKTYPVALELHRKVLDNLGAANDLKGLAELLVIRREAKRAQDILNVACESLRLSPDVEGDLELRILKGRLAALKGEKDDARRILQEVQAEASARGFVLAAEEAQGHLVQLTDTAPDARSTGDASAAQGPGPQVGVPEPQELGQRADAGAADSTGQPPAATPEVPPS